MADNPTDPTIGPQDEGIQLKQAQGNISLGRGATGWIFGHMAVPATNIAAVVTFVSLLAAIGVMIAGGPQPYWERLLALSATALAFIFGRNFPGER